MTADSVSRLVLDQSPAPVERLLRPQATSGALSGLTTTDIADLRGCPCVELGFGRLLWVGSRGWGLTVDGLLASAGRLPPGQGMRDDGGTAADVDDQTRPRAAGAVRTAARNAVDQIG